MLYCPGAAVGLVAKKASDVNFELMELSREFNKDQLRTFHYVID